MQQHMIPQDVTGYKFNLFGVLNVSQFLQLIIPIGVAFLIWQLQPPLLISLPLIIILIIYGAVAAFVPINDRPLSHWVVTFFKIMYSPTKFYWRRESFIPDYFNFISVREVNNVNEKEIKAAQANELLIRRTKATAFFKSMEKIEIEDPLEIRTNSNITELLANYNQIPVATDITVTKQNIKRNLSQEQVLRTRQMQTPENIFGT